jgi:hypothetical protein
MEEPQPELALRRRPDEIVQAVTFEGTRGLHPVRPVEGEERSRAFGFELAPVESSLEDVLQEAAELLSQQEPPVPERAELLLDASDPLLIDPAD